MHTLILIPENLATNEYTPMNSFEEIRPFKLVAYEEILESISKYAFKLLKDIEKCLQRNHSGNVKVIKEQGILRFYWKYEKYPTRTFDTLIENLDKRLREMKVELKSFISSPFDKEGFSYEFQENSYEFIECIYCVIQKDKLKSFMKVYRAKPIEILENMEEKTLLKVFCLKNEVEGEKLCLQQNGAQIYNPRLTKLKKTVKADGTIHNCDSAERILELFYECLDISIISSLSKAMTESLDKYSLISKYRYRIIEGDDVYQEISKLKKDSKIENIQDLTSVVNLDL